MRPDEPAQPPDPSQGTGAAPWAAGPWPSPPAGPTPGPASDSAPAGSASASQPEPGYPPTGWPPAGPGPGSYPQGSYPQAGYPQGSYPQTGYPPAAYGPAGYPPPLTAQPGKPAGRRRALWWIVGAVVVVVAVVIAVTVSSSKDGKDGADLDAFCPDFSLGWSHVIAGVIVGETMVDSIHNYPGTFNGASVDDMNALATANEQASVIAKEAPGSVREKITAIAGYLAVMVKVGNNDQTAIKQIPRGSFSQDAAYLSASVPMQECAGH